jgi:protein-S-isoprenylcysteine O-methyltransferase Ste14
VRFALVLGLYLAITFIPFADRRGIAVLAEGPAARWLGVALCLPGYVFIFWSGLALGRQYSAEVTIQKDHRLITSGPYRWIQHPRYLGVILFRIHAEEELLHREFGEEWERYSQKSWRIAPGIF